MGIEDVIHFPHSAAAKAGAAGSKSGPTFIVPARNPRVGFPDASVRGTRTARSGTTALREAFSAGFFAAIDILPHGETYSGHDKRSEHRKAVVCEQSLRCLAAFGAEQDRAEPQRRVAGAAVLPVARDVPQNAFFRADLGEEKLPERIHPR
jgi:hypothetical protein